MGIFTRCFNSEVARIVAHGAVISAGAVLRTDPWLLAYGTYGLSQASCFSATSLKRILH